MNNYQIANNLNENTLLVLGFFSDETPSEVHSYNLEAYLDSPVKPQKALSTLFYHHAQRPVLLINLGKKEQWSQTQLSKAAKALVSSLKPLNMNDADICLPAVSDDANLTLKSLVIALNHHSYVFSQCKSNQDEATPLNISILADANEEFLTQAKGISSGVKLARDLGNLPPNLCTPSHLVDEAKSLAKSSSKLKATILDEKQMKKMGMNTLLSVSRGSEESAYLIDLRYQNGGDMAPIVLVGKGITFDSGGLSLKPPKGMEEMKFDMCGAASVLGVMKAVCELELPINLNVLVATSENLPGPTATRPGDVVESYSKQTVEILNTDAEGRLVLCDALTYAEQFNPQCVIDVATLTGAIIISLGHHTNGIMGNDDALCESLLTAGRKANDKGWQLPLWDEYQEMLKSNVADIANISSGGGAGSITAGCFLSRFTKNYAWAHIDIAGTAWQSGKDKCATGRPVPLLMQFLFDKL